MDLRELVEPYVFVEHFLHTEEYNWTCIDANYFFYNRMSIESIEFGLFSDKVPKYYHTCII